MVIVERRSRGVSLRHLVGCPEAPKESPQDNTPKVRAETERCRVCFTSAAEAPPKGQFAVFAVFGSEKILDAFVGVSGDPESARYQLIKKAQRHDASTPDFIAVMVARGENPLTFSDPAKYPRASRILRVVPAADRSKARTEAIRQLEREGWKVRS